MKEIILIGGIKYSHKNILAEKLEKIKKKNEKYRKIDIETNFQVQKNAYEFFKYLNYLNPNLIESLKINLNNKTNKYLSKQQEIFKEILTHNSPKDQWNIYLNEIKELKLAKKIYELEEKDSKNKLIPLIVIDEMLCRREILRKFNSFHDKYNLILNLNENHPISNDKINLLEKMKKTYIYLKPKFEIIEQRYNQDKNSNISLKELEYQYKNQEKPTNIGFSNLEIIILKNDKEIKSYIKSRQNY